MLPLLATVDEVRARLTFGPGLEDVERAIEGALQASTTILRSRIRTKFDYVSGKQDLFQVRATHVEAYPAPSVLLLESRPLFNPHTGLFPSSPLYTVELLTNQGFILNASAVSVEAATLIQNFNDPNLVWDLRNFEDGADHVSVDPEKGVVFIHQLNLEGLFVRVTYDAGFTVNSENVYEIPDEYLWLKEMAILHSEIMLDANPVIRREDGAAAQVEVLNRQLLMMYDEHVRYKPSAVKPLIRT